MSSLRAAPARSLVGRTGALVFALVAFTACDRIPGSQERSTLHIGDTTIHLGERVRVHEISVAQMSRGDFDPASIIAAPGDVLQLATVDMRTHALAFDEASLTPQVRQILADKQQLRSPPLVTEGTAWVVSLEGIPPGTYRINCLTHNSAFTLNVKSAGTSR